MASRRRERELALQLAFAIDQTGDAYEDAKYRFLQVEPKRRKSWGDFAERLAAAVCANQAGIDSRLRESLEHWRLERVLAIDRCVLRLAVCELVHFADIPMRATINEYIEIARDFGGDESPSFVNGVLDKIAAGIPGKDFEAPPPDGKN
jgi:N utilization substance protein B